MRANLLDSRILIDKKDSDEHFFTEKDLQPGKPFFRNNPEVLPESFDVVSIYGLLEHHENIRYIIKIADYLLAVNGTLCVKFCNFAFDTQCAPFRGQTAILTELSICFKERMRLIEKVENGGVCVLKLRKIKECLPVSDNINSWTFGIVSDGKRNESILKLVESIIELEIPKFEILVCGPPTLKCFAEYVKVIDDRDLYLDLRIPISKKKNRIIENANYNNLVIIHDRFTFSKDWYVKIKEYGNYFDGICPKILDVETKTKRVQDWIASPFDHLGYKKIFPVSGYLDYCEWSPYWTLNGGHLLIKKHLLERVHLNSFLHWGENEDGDLSRRLDADGFCPVSYHDLVMFSSTHRLKQPRIRKGILRYLQRIKYLVSILIGYYKRKLRFNRYLKKCLGE